MFYKLLGFCVVRQHVTTLARTSNMRVRVEQKTGMMVAIFFTFVQWAYICKQPADRLRMVIHFVEMVQIPRIQAIYIDFFLCFW